MNRDVVRNIAIVVALGAVLAVPFALRPAVERRRPDALPLVIISPHNEAIRHEFDLAFRKWHMKRFGRDVNIDWRNIGGTSEIVRYINGAFTAADRVSASGIGVDLFFGGGQYDHARQAQLGHLAPCGFVSRHPEWLAESVIPRLFAGEEFYDSEDRWYGCCLAGFGICYNEDVLRSQGVEHNPRQWTDLADFRLFGTVALADPTQSGSINKAFEMLIQEQMVKELASRGRTPDEASAEDLAAGWRSAINLIRVIGANTRYFTDSASKVPMDVAQGNASAGMCIDFYGRFESEMVARNEGSDRMSYVTPVGGSSASVDPIAMFRGAPNRETAERFIDFCMGEDGQKLWNYKVGEIGGPVRYALRRLPIRRDMYTAEHLARMSDPDALPYERVGSFVYRGKWTASLFSLIQLLVRAVCIDTHDELVSAWRAINAAGGPEACPEAMAAFFELPPGAEFAEAKEKTAAGIRDPLRRVRTARDWTVFLRRQYRLAERLAEGKAL